MKTYSFSYYHDTDTGELGIVATLPPDAKGPWMLLHKARVKNMKHLQAWAEKLKRMNPSISDLVNSKEWDVVL